MRIHQLWEVSASSVYSGCSESLEFSVLSLVFFYYYCVKWQRSGMVPELGMMVKSMAAAARSVSSTLAIILALM